MLAPVLLFFDALIGRRLLAPSDGFRQSLPWYVLTADAWRNGQIPGWNPFSFSGYPLLAIQQPGAFYPVNWAFVILPPVFAHNFVIVANFILAGLGAWLLTKKLCGDRVGAVIAGLAFGLSGFMFARIGHVSMLSTAVWLPWTLFGFELLRERISPGRLMAASGFLALAAFAGHGQMFFTILLVLGIYAVVVTVAEFRQTKGRPLLALGLMGIVAFGLAAVQLIPTVEYIPLSDRSSISYQEAMTFSLPKSHFSLLLFPYLFGNPHPIPPFDAPYSGAWFLTELTGYPGLAALVLVGAGLAALRRDRRLVALTIAGTVTLALAFGPETPLSRIVYRLPIYGQFRAWGRNLVGFDLAVAVLAGYGVALLRRGSARERANAVIRTALIAGGVVLATLVFPRIGAVRQFLPDAEVNLFAVGPPVAAALLGAMSSVLLWRRVRIASALLVLIVAVDPIASFGYFYEWRTTSPPAASFAREEGSMQTFWGGVKDAPGGIDRYLFLGSDPRPMHVDFGGGTDYKGLYSVNGIDPLAPRDYLRALGMGYGGDVGDPSRFWGPDSRLMDLLRVTTVIANPESLESEPPPARFRGPGVQVGAGPLVRYEYLPRFRDAFLVGETVELPREEALGVVYGDDSYDLAGVALIEDSCGTCPRGSAGPAGAVHRIDRNQGMVTIELTAERPAVLIVSQSWMPGWTAISDGKTLPVMRVDGLLQGIPVGAGRHRILMSYTPPGLKLGATISLAALLGLLVFVIVHRLRRGNAGKAPPIRRVERPVA